MMRETHWYIRKDVSAITQIVPIIQKPCYLFGRFQEKKPHLCYYCCCCICWRRPISTFQITCYLFKKPVTYSLLFQKIHSNCIRWCCQQQMWCCCCCICWRRSISTFKMTCYLFGHFLEKKPFLSKTLLKLHMLMLKITMLMLLLL